MNTSQAELLIPKEGDELRLSGDGTVQVAGYIRNPAPGQATIVFLFIQPNRCPIIKSVNVEVKEPETKKDDRKIISFRIKEEENVVTTQITIKVIREYSDGTLSCDVFTI